MLARIPSQRKGHDPELAVVGRSTPKPALRYHCEKKLRLEASPGPGDLNGHCPDMPVARFRDAQFAVISPTLITVLGSGLPTNAAAWGSENRAGGGGGGTATHYLSRSPVA